MITIDYSGLLARLQWSDQTVSLSDLCQQQKDPLPVLARVVSGRYPDGHGRRDSGTSLSTGSVLLLNSVGRRRHLVAQSIKFKERRRVLTGNKLLVPDSFEGLFEILSEGGKCVRALESVAELAHRFPDSCLVRQPCKAFVSRSDNVDSITDRSRTLQSGETLVLVGEVMRAKGTRMDQSGISNAGQSRFLRCFDSVGENVYLPFELKARFSAMAKEDSISGVHTTGNLLNKRLPLNVRLVNDRALNSLKSSNSGTGHSGTISDLIIHTLYDQELLTGVTVCKDSAFLLIPNSAPIKVQTAINSLELKSCDEFLRLRQRSEIMWLEAMHRIHPFSVPLPRPDLLDTRGVSLAPAPSAAPLAPGIMSRVTRQRSGHTVDEYDEIDQIYDYVRGFAPLPKSVRAALGKSSEHKSSPISSPHLNESNKPEPPPIETIPSRKNAQDKPISVHPGVYVANIQRSTEKSAHKRSHQATVVDLKKAHKNDSGQANHFTKHLVFKPKTRLFRPKNHSPLKNSSVYYVSQSSTAHGSVVPSALFNMRYKSLNNLAMDSSNTLNSSTSGEKASGDSADSAAIKASLPQKKPKKLLGRPRSMTNLAWSPCMQPMAEDQLPKPDLIKDQLGKNRMSYGIYKKRNSAVHLIEKPPSAKKLGTLYL